MVLFLNTNIGQYVEVQHQNRILCGTIRYKGHLNGEKGEWIGVELEYPFGRHNGCWRGRQYFKCPANCGLFTHASNIRFRRSPRKLRDKYHKVCEQSSIDETLFGPVSNVHLSQCYSVSRDYVRRAQTCFESYSYDGCFPKEARYPLSHSVGRNIPAASMLAPRTSAQQVAYRSCPTHCEYSDDTTDFVPRNISIPHYTMPHEALKRQIKRGGWHEFGLHRPRFSTV